MKTTAPSRAARLSLVTLVLAAGCGSANESQPRTVRPGAPGEPSRVVPDPGVPARGETGYDQADVRFMQDMHVHHAQALVMTELVPERTDRQAMRLLARRIELSQETEMAQMRRWLEARGEAIPEMKAMEAMEAGEHHTDMPGMASPEELARLAAAEGDAFDRLFLELMIRHHEGALVMVAELLEAGGGEEPELFQFVAHVDSDQRAEIARMRRMLNELRNALPERGTV